MALHALELSGAAIGASVTGLAGPLGDGSAAPVGTVFVGVAQRVNGEAAADVKPLFFQGTRQEIRMQAALAVLEETLKKIINNS
jgi:nicotinamide mononucleotide (NMN) deamidase PncC